MPGSDFVAVVSSATATLLISTLMESTRVRSYSVAPIHRDVRSEDRWRG